MIKATLLLKAGMQINKKVQGRETALKQQNGLRRFNENLKVWNNLTKVGSNQVAVSGNT